jgi:succinyl-diaminopimelate desuccinylase
MDKNQIIKEAESFLDNAEKELEADLASLIAIPSVASKNEGSYTFGAECAKALDTAIAMGSKYGFRTENHDYYCASIISGNKKDEVGIVAHLDVVPAGSGWSYEPYRLTVEGDKYVGRGALDDKGPFICGLYTMRFLKEKGIDLPFSIRLIAGSDEEVGALTLSTSPRWLSRPSFHSPRMRISRSVSEKREFCRLM